MGLKTLSLFLTAMLLSACASTPKTDYDLQFDFTKLKRFEQLNTVQSDDPLSAQRIQQDIYQSLTQKGFEPVDDMADFHITYAFKTEEKPRDSGLSIGLGTGSWGKSGGVSIGTSVGVPLGRDVKQIQTIQIDIIEPQSNRLIWRGTESFEFDSGGEDKAERTSKTVEKILSAFPPTQS